MPDPFALLFLGFVIGFLLGTCVGKDDRNWRI